MHLKVKANMANYAARPILSITLIYLKYFITGTTTLWIPEITETCYNLDNRTYWTIEQNSYYPVLWQKIADRKQPLGREDHDRSENRKHFWEPIIHDLYSDDKIESPEKKGIIPIRISQEVKPAKKYFESLQESFREIKCFDGNEANFHKMVTPLLRESQWRQPDTF